MTFPKATLAAVFLVLSAGCDNRDQVLSAPSPQASRSAVPLPFPAGTWPPATKIFEGEAVMSTVSADDVVCEAVDPFADDLRAPCRTFQFTAPRAGTLTADLLWSSRGIYMELLTPRSSACCTSPLRFQIGVSAGTTYLLAVGFHGTTGAGPKGNAPFELTLTLVP